MIFLLHCWGADIFWMALLNRSHPVQIHDWLSKSSMKMINLSSAGVVRKFLNRSLISAWDKLFICKIISDSHSNNFCKRSNLDDSVVKLRILNVITELLHNRVFHNLNFDFWTTLESNSSYNECMSTAQKEMLKRSKAAAHTVFIQCIYDRRTICLATFGTQACYRRY